MKLKILIVTARYYKDFSNNLEFYASKILDKSVKYKFIPVPGIFEIPVVISKNIKKYDGFVALGIVIKGETPHFDFISKTTFEAIMNLSIQSKKPIGNGIITALNMRQAIQRSGDPEVVLDKKKLKKGKGSEAAKAVISVLSK